MLRQLRLKQRVEEEIEQHYKAYFESKLAISWVRGAQAFSAVTKVTSAIIDLMRANEKKVTKVFDLNEAIIKELKPPYFGALYKTNEEVAPEKAYQDFILALESEVTDLAKVMQLHCIFIHRIYPAIADEGKLKEVAQLRSRLFPGRFFAKEHRGRSPCGCDVSATKTLGITRHPVYENLLPKSEIEHLRAIDKFKPDTSVPFFQKAVENNLPVVCGISGHTGSLIMGAKLYGSLDDVGLKEYVLAAFAFLVAGGNHSFYEVQGMAELAGIEVVLDYHPSTLNSLVS